MELFDRKVAWFKCIGIYDVVALARVNYKARHPPVDFHLHGDCFELTFYEKGNITYLIAGAKKNSKNCQEFSISSNEILVLFPNERHSTGKIFEDRGRFYYMYFRMKKDTKHFLDLNEEETAYIRDFFFGLKNRIIT